jgi:hypothetical protein
MTSLEQHLADRKISPYKFIKAMGIKSGAMGHWYEKLKGERSITPEDLQLILKTYTLTFRLNPTSFAHVVEKMRLT